MPDLTPRLGLKKPLGNENVTRAAHNENLDIIDANAAKKTDLDAHTAATSGVHGATAAATPSTLIQRDAAGRAKVAVPSAADDIARKDTVDAVQTSLTTHTSDTAAHGATNAATANTIARRDANGRMKAAAPAASDDVARKQEADAALTAAQNAQSTADAAFTSASNGKNTVAAAITGMGQTASGSETFAQLATKISSISSDANAGVGDVLTGKTFYQGGVKRTGTMPNNGALGTYTPGTTNQTIPAGYTSGGTVLGDPDLIAPNILNTANIFGVQGSAIAGRPFASGSGVVSGTTLTVTGLSFQPTAIVCQGYDGSFRTRFYSSLNGGINTNFMVISGGSTTDVGPFTITASGFSCAWNVSMGGQSVNWVAYG